ncbi:Short-chain dehydrogenase/reductase SDR [Penicillium daleae]|uniref:Short-chain dehydrogenase/reductase SDR n=1 Tax=Penicillium daleae TaxID=63821 RepID=A0AAD6G2T7_9EURO|nr:Short-chain dehydrogenase/reductase SDR [Penicillium daleae]KAJ5453686.1 Short-chain dehydrogenase/reductase SDR [Penicillium daleae]
MPLTGQTVLLTGASMGIGEAIAKALAKEGANLIFLSRSEHQKPRRLIQEEATSRSDERGRSGI